MHEIKNQNMGNKFGDFSPKIFSKKRSIKCVKLPNENGVKNQRQNSDRQFLRRRISTLRTLYLRRTIDSEAYAAGQALQRDWERAEPTVTTRMREYVDGAQYGCVNHWCEQTEREKKIQEVLKNQNKRGKFLIASICLENKTFQDVQEKTGWQLRYISERFREALDDLAIAYGFKIRM